MAINKTAIQKLINTLGTEEAFAVYRLASRADELEKQWRSTAQETIAVITTRVIGDLISTGKIDESKIDITPLLMLHYFGVSKEALETTYQVEARLSLRMKRKAPPKGVVSKSLAHIKEMYDAWKNTGKPMKRQQSLAEKWKAHYLKKVKSVWKNYSKDFREGKVYNQDEVRQAVKKAAKTTYARANTIVETETTRHWNETRRELYDELDDITHYLFMAIRDYRTTKWCKTRDGVVYKKGTAYLERETPPVHWNCRSEIIPLSPHNPRHKAMIQERGRIRENRRPEPLPSGWNK